LRPRAKCLLTGQDPVAKFAQERVVEARRGLLAAMLDLIVIILLLTSTPGTPARHIAEINHWYAQPAPGDTAMPDQPALF